LSSTPRRRIWSRQASLIHTDLDNAGPRDLDPPATTPLYLITGTQHGGGAGGLPRRDRWLGLFPARNAENSVDYQPLVRAALVNLDRWVSAGHDPPASRYPRLDDGTAVPPERVLAFFRAVPGVHVPAHVPTLARLDFGLQTDRGVLLNLPPAVGAPYPSVVPELDDDGNEVAGLHLPDVAAPLASYTGWNVRHPEIGAPDELLLRAGATLPFPRSAAEQAATGDPRRSIEERYASREDYLGRMRAAATELVQARYLLEEDIEPILERDGVAVGPINGGIRARASAGAVSSRSGRGLVSGFGS
jgi:hypothetical protein